MLYNKIKEARNEFRKSTDMKSEYEIATLLMGELDTLEKRNGIETNDITVISVAKKLMKSNNETISLMKEECSTKERLKNQNKFLESLLPVMLDESEIRKVLFENVFSNIPEGFKVLDMNNKGCYDRAVAAKIIKEIL